MVSLLHVMVTVYVVSLLYVRSTVYVVNLLHVMIISKFAMCMYVSSRLIMV